MNKYPVYFIVMLAFFGIAKLLQVTIFDSKQYDKNKEEIPYQKSIIKKQTSSKSKEQVEEDNSPLDQKIEVEDNQFESDLDESTANDRDAQFSSLRDLKNNYLNPIIAKLPEGQLREDVVLRYYKHEKDKDKVYTLRSLGYYIHEKEVTETIGLGSNVLYYGEDVNLEDIQIVGLVLLDQGLPLKSVQSSQFDWKSNAIEIGTDSLLQNASTLTANEILSFSKKP